MSCNMHIYATECKGHPRRGDFTLLHIDVAHIEEELPLPRTRSVFLGFMACKPPSFEAFQGISSPFPGRSHHCAAPPSLSLASWKRFRMGPSTFCFKSSSRSPSCARYHLFRALETAPPEAAKTRSRRRRAPVLAPAPSRGSNSSWPCPRRSNPPFYSMKAIENLNIASKHGFSHLFSRGSGPLFMDFP